MDNLWIKFVRNGEVHVGEVTFVSKEDRYPYKEVYWVPHHGQVDGHQILEIRGVSGRLYNKE